jgi:hypothetical protein
MFKIYFAADKCMVLYEVSITSIHQLMLVVEIIAVGCVIHKKLKSFLMCKKETTDSIK